jgi:hypothetical protein
MIEWWGYLNRMGKTKRCEKDYRMESHGSEIIRTPKKYAGR